MGINKEKLKESLPFLERFVHWAKWRQNELKAFSRHCKRKRYNKATRNSSDGVIKVFFICQYIPAWSKNKQLFEALKRDKRFNPILLCVPNRIFANQLQDKEDMTNDVYDYFVRHGYKEALNALVGKDVWYDLKEACADYVIYNRYDRPMPIPYTSTEVSSYSKVCLIDYGTSLLHKMDLMYERTFIANIYCLFAESEEKKREFKRRNRLLCLCGLSRAECCGIPAVENAFKAQNDIAPAWSFSNNGFRAIYAPRWTMDPSWGGSSFIKYRDTFFELADSHPEMDFLVRPHPLMFQNFIDTGLMNAEEVEAYKEACNLRSNMQLDNEKEYLASFWNSNVLICDFSSMIIEYYITKKPIIYLTYDESVGYGDQMTSMLKGCYLVNDEDGLKYTINMLFAGEDPMASIRAEVCEKELLCGNNLEASENMKQVLLDGYRR